MGKNNGLVEIARALVETPKQTHLVIAVVNSKTLTTDVDSESRQPAVRVIAIEPILDDADAATAVEIMQRAIGRRNENPSLLDAVMGDDE
jgi:hypothetical protein